MIASGFGRSVLGIGAAFVLLTGCGGSQTWTAGALPQSAVSAVHGVQRASWMKRGRSNSDLLYVTHEYAMDISVYTYPDAQLVGTLSNSEYANGDCADSKGNVFIVNFSTPSGQAGEVVEYAHGGTQPIQTFSYPNAWLNSCAVDPTTGNLAVIDYHQTKGNGGVLIYSGATGTPTKYTNSKMVWYGYCAYDAGGNLYIDGENASTGNYQLAKLPKGKKRFTLISLSKRVESELFAIGGVQWDGTDIVIGNGRTGSRHVQFSVYRVHVNGSVGQVVGETQLKGAHTVRDFQFSIQGNTIISPFGSHPGDDHARAGSALLGLWTYPQGKLTKFVHDREGPWAVTVSVAPPSSRISK
jgi:hypothetical protein